MAQLQTTKRNQNDWHYNLQFVEPIRPTQPPCKKIKQEKAKSINKAFWATKLR